jgi:hypothetical protein
MSRRNYNDIFHAQTSAYFAEHPEAEYTKVFYMIRKIVDEENLVDDSTGESMIVNQSLQIISVEFVRGVGIAEDTANYFDTLLLEKHSDRNGTTAKIPRFTQPGVYTEHQIQSMKKLGYLQDD